MSRIQARREHILCQVGHDIAEKSSNIVSLDAPLLCMVYFQRLQSLPLERGALLSLVPDLQVMYHKERSVPERGVV